MSKLLVAFLLVGAVVWSTPESGVDGSADASVAVSECELANEWVAAHRDALPKTLEAFGEHSVTFRRAIYGALDTDARISLWRQNLTAVSRGDVSPGQRLFLERVSRELDYYLRGDLPPELDTLTEEARRILGEDLAFRAIAMLGPATPTEATADDLLRPACSCSTQSDWCWFFSACAAGGCQLRNGCGTLWRYRCNGQCYFF